jgi:hypothetical protein
VLVRSDQPPARGDEVTRVGRQGALLISVGTPPRR